MEPDAARDIAATDRAFFHILLLAGFTGGTENPMKLGEMNWPDIRDLDKERLVAVYPIASFEQHGLHLPLLTDTIQLDAMVESMDGKIGDRIVCLPTQWLGYSFHHMRFGGSLTARSQTHIRMLVETVDGLIGAGFDKVLVINGHGGNSADLRVALQELKETHAETRVYGASWWGVAAPALDAIREAGPNGSGHAGEAETSMMLTLRPDLVQTDRLHPDGERPPSVYAGRVEHFRRIDEHSSRGNFGDPTVATADKGQRMLDATVNCLVEIVDDILGERL